MQGGFPGRGEGIHRVAGRKPGLQAHIATQTLQ